MQQFLRGSLVRPELLPLLEEWKRQVDAGDMPTNLLEDEEYLAAQLEPYRATEAEAQALVVEAEESGSVADDYVLTTLLLASALFFAGITTSFRVRFAQVMLLAGAAMLIAYAAARLAELSVA